MRSYVGHHNGTVNNLTIAVSFQTSTEDGILTRAQRNRMGLREETHCQSCIAPTGKTLCPVKPGLFLIGMAMLGFKIARKEKFGVGYLRLD
jgi:hypothetical protein